MNVCCYLCEMDGSEDDNFANTPPEIVKTAHKTYTYAHIHML